jgi:hypothetical protein
MVLREATPAFQATSQAHLQQALSPAPRRPILVFSQDERRFGLLTVRRWRHTAHGVRPISSVQQVLAWFDVYGAVAPTTGERFPFKPPVLDAESFQLFSDAFGEGFPDSLNLLPLDLSEVHTAQRLILPRNVWEETASIGV